jgi:hypothetical protein
MDEYLERMRWRYVGAKKREKGKLLDEVCAALEYHRKAAIRALGQAPGQPPRRSGRPVVYGPRVTAALVVVWQAADCPCGKRLAPFLPELVAALERCGELRLLPEVRAQLVGLSAATIDRLLASERRMVGRQPYRASPVPGSLKAQVPIRTFGEWKDVAPGSIQADLVLHCGESVAGFFLTTLVAIDVATGWTECEGIWGLGKQRVVAGLHRIRTRLPMGLRELHTDNGGEFLNHALVPYCQREAIPMTRGRPYQKNDQAYVEQRNGHVVRRRVGYDRYSTRPALELLRQYYGLLRLYLNFFQPIRKLLAKERVGARVIKRYDQAATPYQRLLRSGATGRAERARLEQYYLALNPIELKRAMDETIQELRQERASLRATRLSLTRLKSAGRSLLEADAR